MLPDGAKRKRHCGHNSQARWYSYYRSLRMSRHYETMLWLQCLALLNGGEINDDSVIYRVILLDRPHIEEILRLHN